MAREIWAGLDVGVDTTSVCVIDGFGEVLHEATCPTDVRSVHREIVFLKRRRFARVGMETGTGMHLARGLRSLGYTVDVYETRQLSKFLRARRNKTDAGDAIAPPAVGPGAVTTRRPEVDVPSQGPADLEANELPREVGAFSMRIGESGADAGTAMGAGSDLGSETADDRL